MQRGIGNVQRGTVALVILASAAFAVPAGAHPLAGVRLSGERLPTIALAALPSSTAFVGLAGRAAVSAPAPGVSVVMVTDSSLVLDSNKPGVEGPTACYVGFRIENTSGAPLTNLSVTLSGFANGIVLGGGQPATQYLGRMAAGEVRTVFWYMQYPTTFNAVATLTATVTDATGSTSGSGAVRTRKMNSSNSGGNTSNGALGPGYVIGQIVYIDTQYEFGGAGAGDVYNIQPSGLTTFDARCFQLVGSEVLSSAVTAIPAGAASRNRLFFTAATSQTGSKFAATFRFYFSYQCIGVSSYAKPYASEQSGSSNLAYSGNWGSYVGPTFPMATNPFTTDNVTKTAAPAVMATGGTATYTVTIVNPSAFTIYLDSIVDVLPGGATYVALAAGSDVTVDTSGSVPATGAGPRIVWKGIPGISYALRAGATLRLIYTATIPASAGKYVNAASPYAGTAAVATATSTITVGQADLAAGKTGPASVTPGDTIHYVLTVSNAGPARAYDVVLRDSLPAGATFVRATRSPTLSGRTLTWPARDSLLVGGSAVDTVIVVAPGSVGSLTNIASVSATTPDPVAANNDGSAAASRATTAIMVTIDVTPKGLGPLPRLPGTHYAQEFVVVNGPAGNYDLVGRTSGSPALVAIDSITGPGIGVRTRADSVRVTLGAVATDTFRVWYTVPVGDTALNLAYLRARLVSDPTRLSDGWVSVRRVFPALTLQKGASPTSGPPGTDITYTITVANAGEYAARAVTVTDSVPAPLQFKRGSAGQSLPAGVTATVAYSSDGGASWGYSPTPGGCGAPAGYDGCVQRIRWTLETDLAAAGGGSSAQFTFVARIR